MSTLGTLGGRKSRRRSEKQRGSKVAAATSTKLAGTGSADAGLVADLTKEPQHFEIDPDLQAGPASAGDHHDIQQLLASVLHQPHSADFQAQLEDPFYEPHDRLLVRHGDFVVGHVHLVKREVAFAGGTIPIVIVNDFAVLPEMRSQGAAECLLAAVNARISEEGAIFGVLRTSRPEVFHRQGWRVCLRHSYSVAGAPEILSHLRETEPVSRSPLASPESQLTVRIWRHVERGALIRLYAEHGAGTYGAVERTDAYWRWLISRRGYDRIYVAIEGPDKVHLDDVNSPIVGYAVVRDERILELVSSTPSAARELLARACRDAIEHDLHYLRLDAAPHDALHEVFRAAGGQQHYFEAENGLASMVLLPKPIEFLGSLAKDLSNRAREAGFEIPCELGLHIGGEKYSLVIGRRQARLKRGRLGRSYLACEEADLTPLLLGHCDVRTAVESGRLHASTRVAVETAAGLFPRLPMWRPAWDESPA